MPNIKIQIVRFLGWEPQPGIVEFALTDVQGREYKFVDKIPIVSSEELDETSGYPLPETLACEILSRFRDEHGREFVRITTERPSAVESTEGISEFVVLSSQLCDF